MRVHRPDFLPALLVNLLALHVWIQGYPEAGAILFVCSALLALFTFFAHGD